MCRHIAYAAADGIKDVAVRFRYEPGLPQNRRRDETPLDNRTLTFAMAAMAGRAVDPETAFPLQHGASVSTGETRTSLPAWSKPGKKGNPRADVGERSRRPHAHRRAVSDRGLGTGSCTWAMVHIPHR